MQESIKKRKRKRFCSNLPNTKAQGEKCKEVLQLVENLDIVGESDESCQHFIEWAKLFTFCSCLKPRQPIKFSESKVGLERFVHLFVCPEKSG